MKEKKKRSRGKNLSFHKNIHSTVNDKVSLQ